MVETIEIQNAFTITSAATIELLKNEKEKFWKDICLKKFFHSYKAILQQGMLQERELKKMKRKIQKRIGSKYISPFFSTWLEYREVEAATSTNPEVSTTNPTVTREQN